MASRKGNPVHGWVILDKPIGLTSSRAVGIVRRIFTAAKAGHGGTLDPLASGLLPIALGEATKTVSFAMDGAKSYEVTISFGRQTTTDDREGEDVATSETRPDAAAIEAIWHLGPATEKPGGWSLSVPALSGSPFALPDLSLVGAFSMDSFARIGVLSAVMLVFTLVFTNFFDAMGTLTGLSREAGLADERGTFPRLRSALVVEGAGAVVGGATSSSSIGSVHIVGGSFGFTVEWPFTPGAVPWSWSMTACTPR